MANLAIKRHEQPSTRRKAASKSPQGEKSKRSSKQARVVAALRSPDGATIASIIKMTGWQAHSVRGFLAGTVRKKLRLKLVAGDEKGVRTYRVVGGGKPNPAPQQRPDKQA